LLGVDSLPQSSSGRTLGKPHFVGAFKALKRRSSSMTRCLGHLPNLLALLAMSCCSMALAQQPRYPQTQTPAAPQRPYQPSAAAPPQQVPPRQAPPQQPNSQQQYPQAQPQTAQAPNNPPPAANRYPTAPAGQRSDTRVAQQPQPPAQPAQSPAPQSVAMKTAGAPEHPIMPTLRWALQAKGRLEAIQDYSCTFVKRELIDDEMGEHQYLFLKVRHQPFSVYIYFMGPAAVKGQEAIYIAGRNNGNLLAHSTGLKDTLVGTLSLKPDSAMAMQGNRHPITDIGLLNLAKKTIASSERATQYADCDVKYYPGANINGRTCTRTQVTLAQERRETQYKMTRIFVDDELGLPIRYETYGWPADANAAPPLVEEYTYLNLKFNNNFTDADFDHKNPAYKFR
jgi:outer membrane lipoprotein-sorting protein